MDSFTAALEQLDPASRALLDLSLRRGMRPEEIGDLLGTDPESVIVAREQALEQLASDLDTEADSAHEGLRTRLAELPAAAWIAPPGTAEATEPRAPLKLVTEEEAAPKPRPERVRPAPQRKPPAKRRRSRMPLLLVLLAAAAVALVVALSSGGDGEQASSNPSAGPNAPAPAPKPEKPSKPEKPADAGQTVKLTPVSAPKGVTGTAALVNGGKRLRLDVTGLPAASYEVWLYDSVIDARSLGKSNGTRVSIDAKLPKNASHYRYVDVSREPADGNPNHSGESVLRVKLSKLAR